MIKLILNIPMKKPLLYLFATVSVLGNWQCKKDNVDFKKFNDPKINPEILTPLANAKVRITDILKQDSFIQYDADGLIRLSVKQEDVLNISADTILDDIKLGASSTKISIGEISIGSLEESTFVTLNDVIQGLNDSIQTFIESKDGSKDTFPAITSDFTTITNIAQNTEYEYLKISNGHLVFKVTNKLPTSIEKIQVNLFDNIPSQSLLGTANFGLIAPFASAVDSIKIAGKQLSNSLSFVVPVVEINKSTDSVLINLNDRIDIDVRYSNVKCIGGKAKLPAQTLALESLSVDLTDPTNDVKFRNVELASAILPVSTKSTINTQINLNLGLPDATKSGLPLSNVNINVPTGQNSTSLNLSNTEIFFGADPIKDHNMLRLNLVTKIQASVGMVEFDSSNSIELTFDASPAKFNYLDGYLGTRSYDFEIEDLDVSQLAELGKGLRLENPSMVINVKNSFGIPVEVKFDIIAKDKQGNSLDLGAPDMNFPFPTIAERGTMKSQNFNIDKTNSNIVNCLSMPASKFDIQGTATMNPAGFTGQFENHMSSTSLIAVGFEANIPMTLTAKNFTYKDTSDVGSSLRGLTDFDFVELKIKTVNGFPMGGSLDLIFTDSLYNPIDSLKDVTLLVSGIANSNGKVVTPSENMSTFLLQKETLQKLDADKCKFIVFKTKFDTYNSGNTPVSIYTDCSLDVSIALRAKYNKQF